MYALSSKRRRLLPWPMQSKPWFYCRTLVSIWSTVLSMRCLANPSHSLESFITPNMTRVLDPNQICWFSHNSQVTHFSLAQSSRLSYSLTQSAFHYSANSFNTYYNGHTKQTINKIPTWLSVTESVSSLVKKKFLISQSTLILTLTNCN